MTSLRDVIIVKICCLMKENRKNIHL